MSRRSADLATSSSLDPTRLEQALKQEGLTLALPVLVLRQGEGEILFWNERFATLLGCTMESKPVPSELKRLWPFHAKDTSALTLLEKVLTLKDGSFLERCEAFLKTYELKSFVWSEMKAVVIVAKLLRSGDLLQDQKSKAQLFHTLSHEIRTSLTGLQGYMTLLKNEKKSDAMILERMDVLMGRLSRVTERLEEFES